MDISSETIIIIHVSFLMWMAVVLVLPIAELCVIYRGLLLTKDMDIDELICYSDSLNCVYLKKGPQVIYHIYVVLIQDIKKLLSQTNVSLSHTREWTQYADFFAKLGTSSDVGFLTHVSLSEDVHDLLKNDAMGTLFLRK
jgi:hypothetical protein